MLGVVVKQGNGLQVNPPPYPTTAAWHRMPVIHSPHLVSMPAAVLVFQDEGLSPLLPAAGGAAAVRLQVARIDRLVPGRERGG